MLIFIKTQTGKVINVELDLTETVLALKQKIAQQENINIAQLFLSSNGRPMLDDNPLTVYEIPKTAYITMLQINEDFVPPITAPAPSEHAQLSIFALSASRREVAPLISDEKALVSPEKSGFNILVDFFMNGKQRVTVIREQLSETLLEFEAKFINEKHELIKHHMKSCNIKDEKIQAIINKLPKTFDKTTLLNLLQEEEISYFLNGNIRYVLRGELPRDEKLLDESYLLAELKAGLNRNAQLADKPEIVEKILTQARKKEPIESLLRENEILYDQNVIADLSPLKSLIFNVSGQPIKIEKKDFKNADKMNELYNLLLAHQYQNISLFAEFSTINSQSSVIPPLAASQRFMPPSSLPRSKNTEPSPSSCTIS